jgi:hypothetical protein
MFYNGVKNEVIYRQAIMRKPPNNDVGYIIDLADIIIPGGVIRVDRSRLAFEHELTLGYFGLPHITGIKAIINHCGDGSKAKNPAIELMISVMLHKMDEKEWTPEELSTVRNINIMDVTPASSPLGAQITLSNDKVYEVYFEEIDGNRMY